MDPAISVLPESDGLLHVRVSKKPIIHNPENQQINQAVAMNEVGERDKQPLLQPLKMSCFFSTAVFLGMVEVTVL